MNAPDRILATASADPAAILRRYYRGHARLYDATRWSFLFGRAALIRSLARLSPPPRHILEIGCGTGSNLVRLVRQFPEAAVTGLDLSADMLARARRKLERERLPVTLLHQRYDRPLYPEPVFDLIVFAYCLTMINPGWERAIDAALRDLRPGGRLAVVDWSLASFLKQRIGRAAAYIARFEAAAAHEAARRGLDGVICGHIHQAALHELNGVLYCNDGDWVESCTALVEYVDGTLEILRWSHHQAVVAVREPRGLPATAPTPGWATGVFLATRFDGTACRSGTG